MNINMKSLKHLLAIIALSLSTFAFGQTVLDANLVDGNLPRATQAEKSDVNLNLLKQYKSAAKERNLNINSIMVLRHGKVVYEEWFGRNKPKDLHVMYSVTKTWNMTAIGFAVDEGLISLDDKVISFFPDMLPEVVTEKLGAMKVRHLLTMTTGNIENEINARRRENHKEDYIKGFLACTVHRQPGTYYEYNSEASFMLAAILQRVTGMTVREYLQSRLFEPLQITNLRWDEVQGINHGGYGLYIQTESMAKLGQLYLQKGMWNGKRLLSEKWIQMASSYQTFSIPASNDPEKLTPEQKAGDFTAGYGFQMWRCRWPDAYRADGAKGQYIMVLPNEDAVIAITSNEANLQGIIQLAWDYAASALIMPKDNE